MFAYCNNNPVMYVDPNGKVIIGICLLILGGVTLTVGLTSCTHSPAQPNESNESADNTDYSWADEDPFLSQGRHSTFDDALNSAADDLKVYANNHNKEVGVFIYELYGGYYVSLPQSGMQAISESVDIDISHAPKNSTVVALVHSHPWHNETLLYRPIEYSNIAKSKIPSYVVDVCGCIYGLFPESNGYTDYTKIR